MGWVSRAKTFGLWRQHIPSRLASRSGCGAADAAGGDPPVCRWERGEGGGGAALHLVHREERGAPPLLRGRRSHAGAGGAPRRGRVLFAAMHAAITEAFVHAAIIPTQSQTPRPRPTSTPASTRCCRRRCPRASPGCPSGGIRTLGCCTRPCCACSPRRPLSTPGIRACPLSQPRHLLRAPTEGSY